MLPVVPVCEPDFYDGDAQVYTTFNMDELPDAHGDDAPRMVRYLIQLHLFGPGFPKPMSLRQTRWDLCRALVKAGFTYPEITNASERKWQHYVLEFEGVGASPLSQPSADSSPARGEP